MAEESVTQQLVSQVRELAAGGLSPEAHAVARHCLLDWFGCAIAGSREPLSRILVQQLASPACGDATLVAQAERATLTDAALINGAMSHALDFDDTHTLMSGHPSVPVVPAVLALAERDGVAGSALINAIVVGIETECRLGALLNPGHYALGFHATGTLGTFGAAAASAYLLDLGDDQWLQAMALAGTQAAGLKSGFGTMAKPLHAGRAASNGLLSALLASGGFTGNPHIVEAEQGFALTHGVPRLDATRLDRLRGLFLINDTLFKYHASCYLTHASIEAARKLVSEHSLRAEQIDSVELRASSGCIGVCDIAEPTTGLEGKFSLRATVGMTLLGDDTSDPAAFTDARMHDADFLSMRDRITFAPQDDIPGTRAAVVIRTRGQELIADADTGVPATDLDRQWHALSAKFSALATPIIGADRAVALRDAIAGIEDAPSVEDLLSLTRPLVAA